MTDSQPLLTDIQIRAALQDRNLAAVARSLNVTRSYLQAFRSGKVKKISNDMRQKLHDYLTSNL